MEVFSIILSTITLNIDREIIILMVDKKKKVSKLIFIVAFIILSLVTYLLMEPFLSAVIIGLLFAYLFYPFQKRLSARIKNKKVSALIITMSIVIIGIIGLYAFTNLLINETITIYESVDMEKLEQLSNQLYKGENFDQYVTQIAEKGLNFFLSVASTLLLKIPELIIGLFVIFIVLFFSLKDYDKLKQRIISYLPVEKRYKKPLLNKFKENMDAVVYSTIAVSFIEGILATIGFYFFGVKTPLLWGLATFVFSMLPVLGPTSVWLPLTLYHYFFVDKIAAIGLGIYCLILISVLVEYIFRTMLIARKGKMHPIVALLGVIGGIMLFGIPGLILGPFVLTTFIFFMEIIFNKEKITL